MNRAERRRMEKLAKKGQQQNSSASVPASIQAMLDTAVQHHNGGNLSEAEALYKKVLTQDPNQPVALHLLGVVAQQKGEIDVAKAHVTKAIAVRPDYTEAFFTLGNILQGMGRYDQAVLRYQQVLKHEPTHPGALNNLASTLDRMGKSEEAIIYTRKSIEANPGQVESHKNLGLLLKKLNKSSEAIAAFEKAAELEPQNPDLPFSIADTLHGLGKIEQAIPYFLKVLEHMPDHPMTHYRLGILYEKIHKLEEAEHHGRRAIELAPNDPIIHYPLAVVLRRRGEIDQALSLLEPIGQMELTGNMASSIHFELGSLYDRSDYAEKAFFHFTKSNNMEAASTTSVKERFLDKVEKHRQSATQLPVDEAEKSLAPSPPAPVFLVGFPRSGTTLLDQILDAHPGIQVMEERPAINTVISAISDDYPENIRNLTQPDIDRLRHIYFSFIDQQMERKPDTLFVDKLPLNIIDIPLIVRLFPNAKILLAMRHPCDVILSNFMQLFILNDAMANFLTLPDAAHCYAKVMGLWLDYEKRLSLDWHMVRYEDLVSDLEPQARSLLEFLDRPWNNAVLDPASHAMSRGRINTPSYQSVTEPLYQRAKYRWERYRDQMAPVMDEIRPFIKTFGYED